MDSGFQILDSSLCQWTLELWIPIFSGIPDSKAQDSVLHKRICSGFRILQAKLSILTWGDASNTHHASEVKALCITAHCYTCSQDTDATYVAVVDYEST